MLHRGAIPRLRPDGGPGGRPRAPIPARCPRFFSLWPVGTGRPRAARAGGLLWIRRSRVLASEGPVASRPRRTACCEGDAGSTAGQRSRRLGPACPNGGLPRLGQCSCACTVGHLSATAPGQWAHQQQPTFSTPGPSAARKSERFGADAGPNRARVPGRSRALRLTDEGEGRAGALGAYQIMDQTPKPARRRRGKRPPSQEEAWAKDTSLGLGPSLFAHTTNEEGAVGDAFSHLACSESARDAGQIRSMTTTACPDTGSIDRDARPRDQSAPRSTLVPNRCRPKPTQERPPRVAVGRSQQTAHGPIHDA